MKRIIFAILLLGFCRSQAENFKLGEPAYGGSGCPAGSAAVVLTPDEKAISILFDSYVSEAGYTTGRSLDRKSCQLAIPVQVPQGYSVAIIKADYRGFASLPLGGFARFRAESFLAGERGPVMSKSFNGPRADNFIVEDDFATENLVFAPCGQSVILRVNTSLLTMTNENFEQAYSAIDSADLSGALVYHLTFRQCH